VLVESGLPARRVLARAELAERRALALAPALPLAHLDRAERLFFYAYDWRGAEREFRRALELDPKSAAAHHRYASFLAARGRSDEALAEVERARALDPGSLLVNSDYAWFFYLARRYDDAVAQARRTLELAPAGAPLESLADQPSFLWASEVLVLADVARGDRSAALAAARDRARWLRQPPPASLESYWTLQERRLAALPASNPAAPALLARPAIELGANDRALDLLLQACQERWGTTVPYLRVDPVYDPLRSHPRFATLLRCANLAEGGSPS
jgi:Tfp pilus assembly protein PilF